MFDDLKQIARIRNYFAHAASNASASFDDDAIAKPCGALERTAHNTALVQAFGDAPTTKICL